MSPSTWLAGVFAVCFCLAARSLYRSLFPVPLPGIPYNVEATRRPLGDVGQIKARGRITRETTEGMFAVARQLGSPIAQLLLTSFSRKVVVVDDPREAEDILTRRNREFDRSVLTSQFFVPLFPRSTISQPTTPALKAQKRLWAGAMRTAFLDRVVAPNIHAAGKELIELWRIKVAQADGSCFEVSRDFANAALDVIWIAILGTQLGVMRREIERVRKDMRGEEDAAPEPHADSVPSGATSSAAVVQEAVEYTNEIVDRGFRSVWPGLTFRLIQLSPTYRRFKRIAYDEVRSLMRQACDRYNKHIQALEKDCDGEELDTCAMDSVLRQEFLAARRNNRPMPDPTKDPAMLEELLLLLLAGHESTAGTLAWFAKLIAQHQDVQTRLRSSLRRALVPADAAESAPALPPVSAILAAPLPYLDAVIHETLRVAAPAGAVARRARVDTTVLGCPIPAGTHVVLNTRFPPRAEVPEALRSRTCRAVAERRRRARGGGSSSSSSSPALAESGREREMGRFEPRRWLAVDADGREVFDEGALPCLVFGGGFRGCFGKKLAMRELRVIIALLMLSFEFLPLPPELSSMAGEERLFRRPRMCHVKLRPLQ